jgi:hypothetical protein
MGKSSKQKSFVFTFLLTRVASLAKVSVALLAAMSYFFLCSS